MGTIDRECLNLVPIAVWIADRRCGVKTIDGECLNLVPIALVQATDLLITDVECEQ